MTDKAISPTETDPTDEITGAFTRFAGREPQEGDHYTEARATVHDEDEGDLVAVTRCWTFTAGRWEGFITVQRGATWSR